MGIEILSSEVVDQIAAGEVVERPAHMVKELVENSLDAGASELDVEFADGGRQVRVVDNGTGIVARELPMAVARHATSKIRNSSDLWSLASFGFRGEALATIAAVSDFEIMSRAKDEAEAHALRVEFGSLHEVTAKSGTRGTSVWVRDLFANVPARLKFLKSAQAEGQQIKTILKAMALSRPEVQFRIKNSGELMAFWPSKTNLIDRAEQVLEINSLYGGEVSAEGWRVQVALSDPYRTEKTSRQIWIFVQGRFIQDRGLQAAVLESYRHLLMHGEFPVAVIKVTAPTADVDINIHPTKSAVKFQNPSVAFRKVLEACRRTLEATPWRKDEKPEPRILTSTPLGSAQVAPVSLTLSDLHKLSPRPSVPQVFESVSGRSVVRQPQLEDLLSHSTLNRESELRPAAWRWSDLKITGQVNATYLVAESADGLVLIDQHAAHERVAFERLRQAWQGGPIEIQQFLLPLALDLDVEQAEALLKTSQSLQKLGVTVEQAGPGQVAVMAAPALLKEEALAEALQKWAKECVEHGGSEALESKMGDILATMACHSVVRAGQVLDQIQMQSLLEQMDEFPQSEFCPHGRPVHIVFPWSKIERDFGRIV